MPYVEIPLREGEIWTILRGLEVLRKKKRLMRRTHLQVMLERTIALYTIRDGKSYKPLKPRAKGFRWAKSVQSMVPFSFTKR